MALLVTGASGHLGHRVVELLLESNAGPIIATTRTPHAVTDLARAGVEVRRADFNDDAALLVDAFRGASRALLVSSDDRAGRRTLHQRRAVFAMEHAGVNHVVYTSLLNPVASPITDAADHVATEEMIARTSMGATILRHGVYAESLLMRLPYALATGQLVDARDNAAVSYVTRDDCARVAANALLMDSLVTRCTLDVTGPAAVSSQDIAALAGELTGRSLAYVPVPVEALVQRLLAQGMPISLVMLWASMDVAAASGWLATVTDNASIIGQRAPMTVRQFLTVHRADWIPDASGHLGSDAAGFA